MELCWHPQSQRVQVRHNGVSKELSANALRAICDGDVDAALETALLNPTKFVPVVASPKGRTLRAYR